MSEDRSSSSSQEKSWVEKVAGLFSNEPRSREELVDVLQNAHENKLLNREALDIMEGALGVSDEQVRDIMIPRSQMVVIHYSDSFKDICNIVMESAHSRFPVVGDSNDDIKGLLLAKDLLPVALEDHSNFSVADILRKVNLVPESKRLNILLSEFREDRQHMAVVVDEYGGVAGLVTIEDVLEEIVGEIEDETDDDHDDDTFIRKMPNGSYVAQALTPIDEFNEVAQSEFSDEEFDTIGGLAMQAFGHLPNRGETTLIEGYSFEILNADSRQIHLLRVTPPKE
ncbi:transporter associated domain-containing protein [uncultured Umboniibacter sp.]|uniref:HlyC/CorC family transporter n=1 Tax=uncultured Umboniibacter sp. TaxID=1798917 RepID=UPI00260FD057|nr:transporter associated domain-containing protein [uncultured Umboniibacter sp.]